MTKGTYWPGYRRYEQGAAELGLSTAVHQRTVESGLVTSFAFEVPPSLPADHATIVARLFRNMHG
eukprot:COSAG05_NODE_8_length_40675_cov_148.837539_44_plen_65_part_00